MVGSCFRSMKLVRIFHCWITLNYWMQTVMTNKSKESAIEYHVIFDKCSREVKHNTVWPELECRYGKDD